MLKNNLFAVKSHLKAGDVTVYGTSSCPWTVKQLKEFDKKKIAYEFKNCSEKGACPGFVEGFPTTVIKGYTGF